MKEVFFKSVTVLSSSNRSKTEIAYSPPTWKNNVALILKWKEKSVLLM